MEAKELLIKIEDYIARFNWGSGVPQIIILNHYDFIKVWKYFTLIMDKELEDLTIPNYFNILGIRCIPSPAIKDGEIEIY